MKHSFLEAKTMTAQLGHFQSPGRSPFSAPRSSGRAAAPLPPPALPPPFTWAKRQRSPRVHLPLLKSPHSSRRAGVMSLKRGARSPPRGGDRGRSGLRYRLERLLLDRLRRENFRPERLRRARLSRRREGLRRRLSRRLRLLLRLLRLRLGLRFRLGLLLLLLLFFRPAAPSRLRLRA